MPLSAGSQLGAYHIVSPLGSGGMGEVYRAHDSRLGRDVALKVLPAEMACDPSRLQRFTREARAIAALNHPHIITIYSTEEADGIRFLTMELVEGQPLDALIPATGLPLARFLELALPLADALTAAHAKQITHRDLKPANVMVTTDGRVKVLDFGLARMGGPLAPLQTIEATRPVLTSEGTIVGTMPYMSPEQIEGKTLDHRTDLFSLGVMLHEMLTGSRPFTGESSAQLMSSILRDVPASASDIRSDVPDALSRLIHRCLEKRPDDRVQTARDIYNELKHVQKQLESGTTRRPDSSARTYAPGVAGSIWIAVLPFSLRGVDPDCEALASGLTEDITAALARFSGLSVVALQSARGFKDSPLDVRQIAERLNARYILNGSVRAATSGYRVAAHLIDAHSGAQLWTETYDRPRSASDIFALQDDLTDRIVATVADKSGVLARAMAQATRGMPLDQLSAMQLVHRSWGFQIRPSPDEHAELRAALESFVRSDPDQPAIWSALANLYLVEHSLGFNALPDSLGRAFRAARRAVEIDPSHQRGWAELAFICLFLRDETGVRDAAERTLALNPRDANAVAYVGNVFTHMGDYDRGCELTERAMALNPSHAGWMWFAPFSRHFARGEFEQALHAARRVNLPGLHWMHACIAAAAGHLGSRAEGQAALHSLAAVAPALVDEHNLRELLTRWYWDEAFVERLLDGVARSRAFAGSGDPAAAAGSFAGPTPPTSTDSPAATSPSPARAAPETLLERLNRRLEARGLRRPKAQVLGTRIAVSRFAAPAADADAAAFASSLTEDVTAGLCRFSYLSVVPSESAGRLAAGDSAAGRRPDGGALRYVLDGSVRRLGSQIRVATRLVDITHHEQLWSETYDRDAGTSTPLAILDDVTDRIVATVADVYGVLLRSMSHGLLEQPLDDLDTDELLLRYWSHERQPEPSEHARLRARFEQLVDERPQLAEAWAVLANLYCQEVMHGFNAQEDSLGRAQRAITRALDLDAAQQHAWHTLAIARYFSGDADGFVHAAERALLINPRNTRSTAFLAFLFSQLGETDRACAMTERAMAINPAHPGWYHFVFFDRHYVRGEYAEALAAARRINMPRNLWSHWAVAVSAGQLGRAVDARTALDDLFALAPAVADEAALEAIVARWRWNKPENVAVMMDGFRKAVALRDRLRTPPRAQADIGPLATRTETSSPSTIASPASIAVLPFADLSAEKNQDWFCDGIAEEILNALTQLPGVHVAARTSAFSFRNQGDDLRSVAEKLRVATVLQGSVRRAGDRVRVTVQLVDAANGYQLWSDRYDRELKDIFDVQDEIACAIAARLKVTLGSDRGRLVPRLTTNLEAYELLLQGRTLQTRRGRAILDALTCFERVVALDPNLAEAHALSGDAYRLVGLYGMAPATEMMSRARAAVERALALDPTQVEALATLANISAVYDWDDAAATAYAERALASDPSHVRSLAERAIGLTIPESSTPETDRRVLQLVQRARELDPLNAWVWAISSYCLALTNRADEAIAASRQAVALDPENFAARWIQVWTFAAFGKLDEAIAASEPALAMSGRAPRILTELAAIRAAQGDRQGALAIFDELRTRASTTFIGQAEQAAAAAAAGHREAARALVAQAIDARDSYLVFWKLPAWAPFRDDPKGMALIRRAGITTLQPRGERAT